MKNFLFVSAIFLCLNGLAQGYQTGKRTVTFNDPSRGNRSIPTEMYYPSSVSGSNVSLASGVESFPVVCFAHGFLISPEAYTWLGDSLARNGYIVVMPSTELSTSPNHATFAADISFLCDRVMSLNDSSASFLYNRVMKRSAAGGHSMGGGSSFLAAASSSKINALFNFAAAETNPSAQQAALQVQIPALVFSGTLDCIVPPATQQTMYSNIPYNCKTYINITGALHCHFANNNSTCTLGQVFSNCNASSLTVASVFSKTMTLLIPFLNLNLKKDCYAKNQFSENYNTLTGVQKQTVCTIEPVECNGTSINERVGESGSFFAYPNPIAKDQRITLKIPDYSTRQLQVFSSSGSLLFQTTVNRNTGYTLPFQWSSPGLYWIKSTGSKGETDYVKLVVY